MKTCVSFMKPITLIKELNIALEHETILNDHEEMTVSKEDHLLNKISD